MLILHTHPALSCFRKDCHTHIGRIDGPNVYLWILVSVFLDGRHFGASMELLACLYTNCSTWSSTRFHLCHNGIENDTRNGILKALKGPNLYKRGTKESNSSLLKLRPFIFRVVVRERIRLNPKKRELFIFFVLFNWQWA